MIRRSLTVLVFGLVACSSALAKQSFPDTPSNHWIIQSLASLKKDGLLTGYPDGVSKPHLPTRHDLAMMVHVGYSNVMTRFAAVTTQAKKVGSIAPGAKAEKAKQQAEIQLTDLQAKITTWRPQLVKLIHEFRKELEKMEATPNDMTWDLADAYNSIEARSVSKPGTNMDFFPDDAEDHWVFQTIRKLKKDGLMVGYSQGLVYHLPPDGIIESRFEFAFKCHACSTNLRSLADELESEAKSIATDDYRQSDLKTNQVIARANELKKKILEWEPELMRLTNEFKRQIAMIGIDPDGMLSNIRSASSTIRRSRLNQPDLGQCQFSDVPANHWAAKQVLELRQLGILTGYPNTDSTPNTFNH